jgi:hypothetical protein
MSMHVQYKVHDIYERKDTVRCMYTTFDAEVAICRNVQ